jgi:hypothetical protein
VATTLTTTTTLTEIVPKIIARATLIIQATAGILTTLRIKDTSGQPGVITDFPTYTPVPSTDVETPGEGTANTNVVDLESVTHLATVAEHVVTARITDLALENTLEDAVADTSTLFASGIMAKLEDDIVNLFSGLDNTAAGAGTTLTLAHIWECIQEIKAGNGDVTNLVGVLSPNAAGSTQARPLAVLGGVGDEMMRMGFVANALGIDWLVSNEINENVASGGDAAGGIYQRGAIGLNLKDLVRIETARGSTGAEARYTSLVATGIWGEVEIYGPWGSYLN